MIRAGLRYLLGLTRRIGANRAGGIAHELEFWDDWLRTRGAEWPESYLRRLDPQAELSEYHRALVERLPQDEITILDVGAGPLTVLGKRHPSKRVRIVATDALAAEYDGLLDRYGIEPPVRTIYAEGERLTARFAECTFDLVTAQNCVDHMRDPLEAIRQMLLVVKPGGLVVLDHLPSEGKHANYVGMHQWDMAIEEGDFLIRGLRRTIRPAVDLAALGAVSECSFDGRFIRVHIRKHGPGVEA
jgi:SAM-dependent methyltransferase